MLHDHDRRWEIRGNLRQEVLQRAFPSHHVWLRAWSRDGKRTLALVEVLFAQAISRFAFKQATTPREAVGIVLIVLGCVLLIWTV